MTKYKEYIDDECEVICSDNGRKIVAEVLSFTQKKNLTVSIDRSVKLTMRWNGRMYETMEGPLSFISNGPDIRMVKIRR